MSYGSISRANGASTHKIGDLHDEMLADNERENKVEEIKGIESCKIKKTN